MKIIKNEQEIINRQNLVNSILNVEQLDEFYNENIFDSEFKYVVFMSYEEPLHPKGFKNILKFSEKFQESFYIHSLCDEKREFNIEIDINNNSDEELDKSFEHWINWKHDFVYYGSSVKWLIWAQINSEISIFACKEKNDVIEFINLMGKEYLFSIDEVISEIWEQAIIKVEDGLRKNYTELSYLD